MASLWKIRHHYPPAHHSHSHLLDKTDHYKSFVSLLGRGSAKLKGRNNCFLGSLWICLSSSHKCTRSQVGNTWMSIPAPPANCWICKIQCSAPGPSAPVCLPWTYCCVPAVYEHVSQGQGWFLSTEEIKQQLRIMAEVSPACSCAADSLFHVVNLLEEQRWQ